MLKDQCMKWRFSRGFWLGKYEVTVGQFRRFVEATGYEAGDGCWTYENGDWEERSGRNWSNPGYSQSDDHPVVCVSWEDVSDYASWLSGETGVLHRLPTEAEWEYACRAGTQTRWSFGDDESRLGDYAWYGDNNDPWGTKAVGGKLPNGWGLYDMHGNVFEWVQDRGIELDYYNRSPRVDPPGPDTGDYRVIRGGGFMFIAQEFAVGESLFLATEHSRHQLWRTPSQGLYPLIPFTLGNLTP